MSDYHRLSSSSPPTNATSNGSYDAGCEVVDCMDISSDNDKNKDEDRHERIEKDNTVPSSVGHPGENSNLPQHRLINPNKHDTLEEIRERRNSARQCRERMDTIFGKAEEIKIECRTKVFIVMEHAHKAKLDVFLTEDFDIFPPEKGKIVCRLLSVLFLILTTHRQGWVPTGIPQIRSNASGPGSVATKTVPGGMLMMAAMRSLPLVLPCPRVSNSHPTPRPSLTNRFPMTQSTLRHAQICLYPRVPSSAHHFTAVVLLYGRSQLARAALPCSFNAGLTALLSSQGLSHRQSHPLPLTTTAGYSLTRQLRLSQSIWSRGLSTFPTSSPWLGFRTARVLGPPPRPTAVARTSQAPLTMLFTRRFQRPQLTLVPSVTTCFARMLCSPPRPRRLRGQVCHGRRHRSRPTACESSARAREAGTPGRSEDVKTSLSCTADGHRLWMCWSAAGQLWPLL